MVEGIRAQDHIEKLARSVDLLLRLKVREINREKTQRETILMLGQLGATGGEIASILGISPTTVYPELSKARDSKHSKRPRGTHIGKTRR